VHPAKHAKNTLVASRVSQRAALLSKRRAAAAVATPPSDADEEEPAPEVLRGNEGETAFNISLGSSSPPTPSPPLLTPPSARVCVPEQARVGEAHDSADEFDVDFEEEEWEDGRHLNTRDPPWIRVFPLSTLVCRFCRKLPPEPDGDCIECGKLTTFQLVKKHAPRWRYAKQE
jgi:hypothetical protein